MQNKLNKGPLLDYNGNLAEAGYSTSLVKNYSREAIKTSKLKIKEWDYYYFGNNHFGFAFTIADNGYMSLGSVSFLDFKTKFNITKSKMGFMSLGKVNLPSSSEDGDVSYGNNKFKLEFYNDNEKRHIKVFVKKIYKNKDLECDINIKVTNNESMVIATPFLKAKHFYYNQKCNLLKANGFIKFGNENYEVKDMYGVLDWGRGVWTYKNTWYWSSLNGVSGGKEIGFNLGYGFGDTSKASENMFFVNKRAYKLDDVYFDIPKNNKGKEEYLKEWKIYSKSKDIDLTFTPILDRFSDSNILIIRSLQHQVFGTFNGTITVDNKTYYIDNLVGFAEKVFNKW